MTISPPLTCSSPASTLSIVDLPEPLRPMMEADVAGRNLQIHTAQGVHVHRAYVIDLLDVAYVNQHIFLHRSSPIADERPFRPRRKLRHAERCITRTNTHTSYASLPALSTLWLG